jgi:lysophospholipase L1-like esterase
MKLLLGVSKYVPIAAMLSAALLVAQEPGTVPETKAPPPVKNAQTPPPMSAWERAHQEQLRTDWPWLAKYKEADLKLAAPAADENRVVFMGDSITEGWHFEGADGSFPGKPYINRGISGQTSPQMLVRFRQDVINLQPRIVVILAGTNDIAGNSGPISNEDIEANYASLADLARANNIRVIFSSVLPVHNYTPKSQDFFAQRPMDRILALNKWLKDYCAANKLIYLDYFPAMIDDKGLLQRDLADDGLHPNKAGFAIMAPMAEKAIEKALSSN